MDAVYMFALPTLIMLLNAASRKICMNTGMTLTVPKYNFFFFFNVAIIGAKSCQDHTCQTQLEAHIPVQSQINYKFHMQTKI